MLVCVIISAKAVSYRSPIPTLLLSITLKALISNNKWYDYDIFFYAPAHSSKKSMASSSQLKSAALLDQMKLHLATDVGKELTKKINLVYQFNIAPKKIGFNEEIYVVDLKKGQVTKGPYEGGKPDAMFSFTDGDFVKVATGKMNPQIAFMRGAMKIKGSLSAAQKFTPDIFPKPSKM
ncbi:hypothetical protein HHK36_030921 [Tetracentron sinense]|uniref:SCP2 domain-containing protein n=1 Tax=Tetracentron sinense TaxID=13715 RepID=A0A834YAE0_TETSI|nr:hypothetical protein HHK36_030921 [Tetracentron sinense]